VERHEARSALLKAETGTLEDSAARGGGAYNTLLAQIKRGKLRGVEAALLARAEVVLPDSILIV
jgi:hypothetical protein